MDSFMERKWMDSFMEREWMDSFMEGEWINFTDAEVETPILWPPD